MAFAADSIRFDQPRKPRIGMPPASSLLMMPADMRERTKRIAWSHVSMGYQPRLTQSWFETMGSFQAEARMDPVFANSYFWVLTRSNECFY